LRKGFGTVKTKALLVTGWASSAKSLYILPSFLIPHLYSEDNKGLGLSNVGEAA
jgi:hypothetical protein